MGDEMKQIIDLLKQKNKTISTMESCTGGFLANEITNIEGASDVFSFSAVTYSNEFKIKLGVSKEIIDTYSVYSINTANEMSKVITMFSNSDYGIGVTGKINREDKNNLTGENNIIYISIYDKNKDKYYTITCEALKKSRQENKEYLFTIVKFKLLEILQCE